MAVSITMARAQARANAETAAIDADSPGDPGYVVLYATPGDGVPASVNNNLTDQSAIVTIDFNTTSFNAATNETTHAEAALNGTPSGDAAAIGDITFFRIYRGVGAENVARIRQGTVGGLSSGADLELSTVTCSAVGQTFTLSTWAHTESIT